MARGREKKVPVGKVVHRKWEVPVSIFYDSGDRHFHAVVGGEKVAALQYDACEDLVNAAIEAQTKIEWERVIVVKVLEPFNDHHGPFVGFRVSRHVVGRIPRADKEMWLERDWPRDGDGEDASQQTRYWHKVHGKLEFAYTEELWLGLQELENRILRAKWQLDEILKSPDKLKLIGKVAALLPAAEPEESP